MLVGISVDGRWSHRAFADDRNLNSPLLSDFESKGEGAKKYGVYDPQAGLCERASMPRESFSGVTSLHQASIRELMAFYLDRVDQELKGDELWQPFLQPSWRSLLVSVTMY